MVLLLAGIFACSSLPVHAADWSSVDDVTLERLATELQAGRDAQALVETLKSILATKDQEIGALREALERGKAEAEARREALIRSEERDKLRAESIALLKDALVEYREALKEAREEIRAMRKQSAVDKLVGSIPIIGMALLLFGFGGF